MLSQEASDLEDLRHDAAEFESGSPSISIALVPWPGCLAEIRSEPRAKVDIALDVPCAERALLHRLARISHTY